MIKDVYTKYCKINEQLEKDEELTLLRMRLNAETEAFNTLLNTLSPEDQQTVTEYMGICAEIDERIVEIAAFNL